MRTCQRHQNQHRLRVDAQHHHQLEQNQRIRKHHFDQKGNQRENDHQHQHQQILLAINQHGKNINKKELFVNQRQQQLFLASDLYNVSHQRSPPKFRLGRRERPTWLFHLSLISILKLKSISAGQKCDEKISWSDYGYVRSEVTCKKVKGGVLRRELRQECTEKDGSFQCWKHWSQTGCTTEYCSNPWLISMTQIHWTFLDLA